MTFAIAQGLNGSPEDNVGGVNIESRFAAKFEILAEAFCGSQSRDQ
jgi:hypothetical protein